MKQVSKYKVEKLGQVETSILSKEDRELISTFVVSNISFNPSKDRLNLKFYDLGGNYIETLEDIRTYKVLGQNKGEKVIQLSVDPVQDALDAGYLGDVIVDYEGFTDVFSSSRDLGKLYVSSISADRTEIRAKSLHISDEDLKDYVKKLQDILNGSSYFPDIQLYFFVDNAYVNILNVITEYVDEELYVTFKLYAELPGNVSLKSQFAVLERVGEPTKFVVTREVEIIPDSVPTLKGPNFSIISGQSKLETTKYITPEELLSYGTSEMQSLYKNGSIELSIDYTDFSSFAHFSSVAERLQNFRYKMQLLEGYEDSLSSYPSSQKLIDGIINNFDHYERHLYFESGSYAWPKTNTVKPYTNVKESQLSSTWWNSIIEEAESYDINNENILIATIPQAIREDENNEPYVVFVHMIGQHFDNEWIYAKAISDRYVADNRADFGISKDLVKEALRGFGIKLKESNQNLVELFKATPTPTTKKIQPQPVTQDEYAKEAYKRIYHNLPFLIKTKGTQRGLRALVSCFGIPDYILSIKTLGGIKTEISGSTYIGPEDGNISSVQKIRLDTTGGFVPYTYECTKPYLSGSALKESGSFVTVPILSNYVPSTVHSSVHYSDDLHEVSVGFELNKQLNDLVKVSGSQIGYESIDEIIGDTRNTEENYGEAFTKIHNKFLKLLKDTSRVLSAPEDVLYLIRYFDLVLLNLIQEFVPARDSVSVGAIVEDNALHRNRYKGITPSWEREDYSGSLATDYVTGSTGGSTEDVETQHLVEWSTGNERGFKNIYDQSPRYNGELGGSYIKVSDGELNRNNVYKDHNATQPLYGLSFYFLDLPSPACCWFPSICTSEYLEYKLYSPKDTTCTFHVKFVGGDEYSYTSKNKSHELSVPNTAGRNEVSVTTDANVTFIGWYSTASSIASDSTFEPIVKASNFLTTGSTLGFEVGETQGRFFAPRYTNKEVATILFNVDPATMGTYYNTDIVLSWSSSADIPSTWIDALQIRVEAPGSSPAVFKFTGGYGTVTRKGVTVVRVAGWRSTAKVNWKWGVDSIPDTVTDDYTFEQLPGKVVMYKPSWFNQYNMWSSKISWHVEWDEIKQEYVIKDN